MADTATASRLASWSFDPVATVVAPLRHHVRALLTGWGVPADGVDDALLVVEELVANVIDHARTRFEVVVRVTGDALYVGVRDHSTREPRLQPRDPQAVRGRGLQLVTALAQRWGCDRHPDGKTVWAQLRT
jgi:anti-sigma regulatory factor (Ser/Thr protein kinase)